VAAASHLGLAEADHTVLDRGHGDIGACAVRDTTPCSRDRTQWGTCKRRPTPRVYDHAAQREGQRDAAAGWGSRYRRVVTPSRFVVQLHDATRLHYDLRILVGGALRSWAVPKGPSMDPGVRRLAVPVEDHELSAGDFEGVHEGSRRGTGVVIIWDEGRAEIRRDDPGQMSVV
jgi:DNA ligase D-like protein (predicted 3'-phosphoesterase)